MLDAIFIDITLSFHCNIRCTFSYWVTLKPSSYGTPCLSVEVADLKTRFIVYMNQHIRSFRNSDK